MQPKINRAIISAPTYTGPLVIGCGASVNSAGGLNKDYITAWSYGKSETFSLLIPNVKGGATPL